MTNTSDTRQESIRRALMSMNVMSGNWFENMVFTEEQKKLILEQPVEVIKSTNSLAITNGHFGGWVQQKDGSYISISRVKSMNRAERRKKGINL